MRNAETIFAIIRQYNTALMGKENGSQAEKNTHSLPNLPLEHSLWTI